MDWLNRLKAIMRGGPSPALALDRLTAKQIQSAGGYSQLGQDLLVLQLLPTGRTFIEIGGYDGLLGSNTKFLEDWGWKGVVVEPNATAFARLRQNRTCICLPYAIGREDKAAVSFQEISGYSAMLSGVAELQPARHRDRVAREMREHGGGATQYEVEQRSLSAVFRASGFDEIDYMSVDVEGLEDQVLLSLADQSVRPKIVSVENNYGTFSSERILRRLGYRKLLSLAWDDFFVHASFDFLADYRN